MSMRGGGGGGGGQATQARVSTPGWGVQATHARVSYPHPFLSAERWIIANNVIFKWPAKLEIV